MSQQRTIRQSCNWGRTLILLGLVALALAFGTSVSTPYARAQAHPQLLQMAAAHPDQPVAVIVQKQVTDASVEQMVAKLDGVVTKDLNFINAFAAKIPAKAVLELAKMPGVRWVSPDGPMVRTAGGTQTIDTSRLANAYIRAIGADRVWNEAPYLQGQGITVAVVDSGIANHSDLKQTTTGGNSRVVATATMSDESVPDKFGHGTHVAGIIGGNGSRSGGQYIGVAPRVNLASVKVSNHDGEALASDVVEGLQWVFNNKDKYNIRVANLSLNSAIPESYHSSPLAVAVELLWFRGVVVVVSAGNNGRGNNGVLFPPANDPFVITVGAVDDQGTPDVSDDTLTSYSAYGTTESGIPKPDLVAPGSLIVSLLASTNSDIALEHPDLLGDGRNSNSRSYYFRMSGTSMAAPMVAGAAALLIQSNPSLNPDQVKYRLKATARPFGPGAGAGYLDVYAAVHGNSTETANTGLPVSRLLSSSNNSSDWSSVNWGSVNWGSVNWGSVNWGSVNWGSVNWGSTVWEDGTRVRAASSRTAVTSSKSSVTSSKSAGTPTRGRKPSANKK